MPPSDRIVNAVMYGICSPTTREYSPAVIKHVEKKLRSLNHRSGNRTDTPEGRHEFRKQHDTEALQIFEVDRTVFEQEAMVNADSELRGRCAFSFCTYDKVTGRNLYKPTGSARFATIGECRNGFR